MPYCLSRISLSLVTVGPCPPGTSAGPFLQAYDAPLPVRTPQDAHTCSISSAPERGYRYCHAARNQSALADGVCVCIARMCACARPPCTRRSAWPPHPCPAGLAARLPSRRFSGGLCSSFLSGAQSSPRLRGGLFHGWLKLVNAWPKLCVSARPSHPLTLCLCPGAFPRGLPETSPWALTHLTSGARVCACVCVCVRACSYTRQLCVDAGVSR